MNSTLDAQAIATADNCYLEQQSQAVAPVLEREIAGGIIPPATLSSSGADGGTPSDFLPRLSAEFNPPLDPIAARIRLIKHHQVREAIVEGEYFWQAKQSFKKLKDFKVWLATHGFTWKDACRHIKLYEIFAPFPLEQIGWLSLDTLYSLCQPKYRSLLEQLRSLSKWIDTEVQELMKAMRVKKVGEAKPKINAPVSGWKRMPSGGGRYYALNLHNDRLGVLIEQYAKDKNWLPIKVIEQALMSLCQLQPLAVFSLRDYKL